MPQKMGYPIVYMADHPRAYRGYVYEHLVVLEEVLGRPLTRSEMVLHLNGKTTDNSHANLWVEERKNWNRLFRCGKVGKYRPILDDARLVGLISKWLRSSPELQSCLQESDYPGTVTAIAEAFADLLNSRRNLMPEMLMSEKGLRQALCLTLLPYELSRAGTEKLTLKRLHSRNTEELLTELCGVVAGGKAGMEVAD